MNAVELYKLCKEFGVNLAVEGADLRLSASQGAIPERIVALVRAHKPALVALLSEHRTPAAPSLPATQGAPALSYAQQRLWFQQLYDEHSAVYNVPLALESRGRLDPDALRAGLRWLVQRHEPLRTAIRTDDGVAAPYLLDAETFALVEHDETADGDALAQRLTAEQTSRAFDLSSEFMLRAELMHRRGQGSLLFLTLHHIAVDGWSLDIIVDELNAAYDAFARGERPNAAPLPHRFSDYASWQQARLDDAATDSQVGYWKRRLAGMPELHRFPLDKARPPVPSQRGDRLRFGLDAAASETLRQLATRQGCTLFAAVQAAFAVFVSRYSDSADVVFGTPVANREIPGTAGMVGYLANVVPVRTRVAPEASFLDVLAQAGADFVADLPHHGVPTEMLIDALQLPRRASHHPLLQMMLVFEEGGQGGAAPAAERTLERSSQRRSATGSKFDLSLIARSSADGLVFAWEYASDLFEPATIARLAENFVQLLRSIVAAPGRPVAELDLLSDEEKNQLSALGEGAALAVEDTAVHRLFERWARSNPDAPALVCGERTLSYRELDEQANALAHALTERGVGRGDVVGICLHHPRRFPLAALAALKAGAAYLPMDPRYPALRIEHIVRDSGARLWLGDGDVAGLSGGSAELIEIDALLAAAGGRRADAPDIRVEAGDLAYMIYTSGSTGLPKGTLLEHRGAVNLALAHVELFDLNGEGETHHRVLQFSSISFDAATWELLMSLCNGGCLIVPEPEEKQDPAAMAAFLRRHGVTHATLPPVYLAAFERDSLPTLRHLIVGGEAIGSAEAQKWNHGRRFHNAYGPTEATVCATVGEYLGGDRVHMGGPIANHRCAVLDGNGRRVPLGAVGELYLGGIGLARGYHNNPQLTAERFVWHSVDGGAAERWYRSGDLVRWLPGGQLEYLGRVDKQVKIRGFRIELGEVESVLASHPEVTAAHAKVWHDEASGEPRLTAYFVLDGAASRGDVREFMEQRLPDYMVPAAYVPMDALPLTAHGKIDSAALPRPGESDSVQREYLAPRSEAERLVCAVLAELLPQQKIGVKDSFYALGGDSILSIRAIARINAHGHRLTSRQFFDARTVEGIAALLENGARDGAGFDQAPSEGAVELLPIQRRFFALRDGHDDRFLQSALLHLPEDAGPAFFAEFLPALYARHDLLRLRLGELDRPQPKAWLHPLEQTEPMAAFAVERLHGLDAQQRRQRIEAAGDACKAAIGIGAGKLFSLLLFDAEQAQDRRLLIAFHHLIVDGVSWRIVLDDLALAFEQYERGEAVRLPAKATGFQEWSRRLSVWRAAEGGLEAQAYWPTEDEARDDDPQAAGTLADTESVTASLDIAETAALLQDSHFAYHTQINDLLLAALAVALNAWNGAGHHDIHLESHGRDDGLFDGIDLGQCLGWFTSLYPVRLAAHGNDEDGLRATIRHAKQALRQVPHLGLGYLHGERVAVRPGVVFNYLGQFDQQMGRSSRFARAAEPTGFDVDRRRSREYALGFNGRVADGRLSFHIDFDARRFERDDVAKLAAGFEQALRRVLAHCRQQTRRWASPADFPLCAVSQADIDQWQRDFGDIEDLYPASGNQLGMLYHAQLEDGASYSTQNLVRFPAGFDAAAFKRAWDWVTQRHAVLRTVFVGLDREQSLQLVLRNVDLCWHEQDLRSLPESERQAAIDAYLRDDNRTPLDQQRAPLARFALFQVEAGQSVFVWSCSHALLDGWSLGVVYRDMLAAYEAMRAGREPAAAPVAEYRRYIEWVQQRSGEEARAFWAQEVGGAEPAERVGIEAASAQAGAGKRTLRHALAEADYAALKRFAAQHGITVSTMVQAAWAYLLARYRDTDCVTTGMTLSGRPAELPGVEDIVGLMVNTVPAVVRLVRDQSLVGWLQGLHERQLQRETFGHMPLSEIVKLAAVDDGQAVFDTVLGFHSQPIEQAASAMQKAGIKGGVGHEHTHYPLVLGVSPHAGLQFTLTYDASRFAEAAMQRLCGHLENVLKGLVSARHRTVGDLDMLSLGEREALAVLAQGPALEREAVLVPALIERHAAALGDKVALSLEDETLSFAGLEARANQIARLLAVSGVQAGDRVGVCQERSLDMLASVIGTMKAGAVYVPLDPGYPDERLAYLLSDAGIGHVLTEAYLAPQLPLNAQRVVLVSDADEQDATAFASPVTAGSPAYMIYTSGSTGQPKGVVVSHGALADKLAALAQNYDLDETDRSLLFASTSFDASISQLLTTLSVGGSVALRPDGVTEPEALLAYVAAQDVTWMHVVPAYLRQLLEVPGWSNTKLRRVSSGGDVLDRGLQQAWFVPERSGIALYNSYGPTEITITSSVHRVRGDEAVVPIGRPLANTRYWVLDEQGHALPHGAVGELCVGGSSLADGYWGRDQQTHERFVELEPVPGQRERLYRSGDRVRWNELGDLEFVGRNDHQVKVRGYRIELGEIEAALQACDGVTGAVVKVEQDSLWAYVSLGSGDLAHVEAELSSRLPGYLLPGGYEQVDEWPLTRSGKIDRRALVRGQAAAPKRREPGNETESALLEIWSALLKTDDIGVTENFFQRGGHSLLATRLASQIRRRFEVDFTLKSLFELPSIEEQAGLILAQKAAIAEAADIAAPRNPAIRPLDHDGPVALSYAQNSLWLLDQIEGSSASYIAGTSLAIDGAIDVAAVEKTFAAIVERHRVLRTVIREHESGPMQSVIDAAAFRVQWVDLSSLSATEAERELLALTRVAKTRRFDLSRDVMLRVHLVKQAEERHTLLVHMHHIVCDGWSVGLLMNEFNALYRAYTQDRDTAQTQAALPALPIQYRDYAHWQRERLSGAYLEELVDYWRERLDGIPTLHALPTDRPRPEQPSYRGAVHRQQLGADVADGLKRLCRAQGATFFMGMHAAFSTWLSRYSGSDDIVLGTAIANREQSEVAPLIGFFSNSIVLRNRIEAQDSFATCLARIKRQNIADFDRQQLPFELLAEKLNPERSLGHNPIFQIVLNLDNNDSERFHLRGSDVQSKGQPSYESNFDLTLYAVEQASGIKLMWRYATDLFVAESIERMAASLESLLTALVAAPDAPLHSLPLADSDELAALQALAAGPEAASPSVLVPELIAAQAGERGQAPALSLGEATLDYAGLERRANQIARTLVAAGVQAGNRVGVCQERTLDMLASVIGTMKAGAVYVPLDPGYPDERLAYLLSDAGIGHVLTEAYLAPQLPLRGQAVVLVSEADAQDGAAFVSPITAESPAYMIYTSGSTGQPKGVVVSHGALADKLAALAQNYGLDETDRSLLFASTSFDASISQLLTTLSVGGSVALRPDGVTEPDALLAYVATQGVTWMHVVPAYLRQLLEVPGWSNTKLRRVSSGGDVLDRGLQQAWFVAERAGIALYNSYGPTEITITSSVHRVRGDETAVPIGRPLANTRYWVLDEQGHALPRGAVGELCIGGSSLADGYWGRDQQTRERFVELEPVPGQRERMYRSGDRARWNGLGELEFVGRNDHQVKVRGYRIELGEIEAALQACDGVAGAVVKVEQDSLCAYVALSSGDLAQVEAQLSSRLPAYLLPSGYERVDEWPLTRSGKIDRNALVRGHAAAPKRREPANDIESALLEIWTALLKTDDIGVTDNFFQRGGHSLLATRLASQIRRRFEVDFTLKSLFELPSIEEQARLISLLKIPAQLSVEAPEQAQREDMEEFDV